MISAFISLNIGAEKKERAVSTVIYGIVIMFVFGIICCTLSQFIGEPMASFFSRAILEDLFY